MCFSASVSFAAGVSLIAFGGITVKMVRRQAEIPFAMIPLLFGAQQLVEGMLWLSFRFEAALLNVAMTYLFTLFSHVLWPLYVPFAIGLIETVAWRKKVIWGFQAVGLSLSLYLLYSIIRFPVISEISENMVYVLPYVREHPAMDLYLAATCVAPFFSSHNFVRLFGVLTLLLFFAALWFYSVALFSVWCFFSAILSVLIYLHFRYRKMGKVMGVQLNS
ncbi:MAG: hypothetical protein B7Y56_12225 [Gallionellales bacterium 35-53-114]|jgi:hypothetical protein|nr:MAG: hypothetical protein B7Y56_12225 [Gallionellales bacterium 35-53-114]OYZ64638.1 MAG: hypothetical protein B7Y04_02375 [Gallionellales bacterium 24-53-125]HQS58462.1 hypothetical protein [Gallionellaceae bacterium]HQS74803.1 hypothetical protein [Gallionellaceae bacterium]